MKTPEPKNKRRIYKPTYSLEVNKNSKDKYIKSISLNLFDHEGNQFEIRKTFTFYEELYLTIKRFLKDSEDLFVVEHVINDLITLKLEKGQTNIYVAGEMFNQCKYVLINIPVEEVKEYDEIKSIDEAINKNMMSQELHGAGDGKREKYNITPDQEFLVHCSNLQAFVENDYDTRILHSNIAFPLLKRLAEEGDPLAKRKYKDEISYRLSEETETVFQFLFYGKYLKVFSPDELYSLAEDIKNEEIKEKIIGLIKTDDPQYRPFIINKIIEKFNNKFDPEIKEKGIHNLVKEKELTDQEIFLIAKKIKDPLLKIVIISTIKTHFTFGLYTQYHSDKHLIQFSDNMLIARLDNLDIKQIDIDYTQSIYEPFDMQVIEMPDNKLLDFGLIYMKRRVCYKLESLKFAKKLLNNSKNIMISIPKRNGYLKIFEKKINLQVLILPEYLY